MRMTLVSVLLTVALLAVRLPAAPTTMAAPEADRAVLIDFPSGWQPRKPPLPALAQLAVNDKLGAYAELINEPREDFGEGVDLMAWAKLVKKNTTDTSKLDERHETDLKRTTVAGRDVIEYETVAEAHGVKLHFRFFLLQVGDTYCKVACWATPSRYDAAQSAFEELVGRLKEQK